MTIDLKIPLCYSCDSKIGIYKINKKYYCWSCLEKIKQEKENNVFNTLDFKKS